MAIAGPITPYITPQILTNAPTGISWRTIPSSKATPAEQLAEQINLCQRATSRIDSAVNNVLRATIETETLYGPDYRVALRSSTGVVRALMSRYPVTQVLSGKAAPAASFPPVFTNIPATAFAVERPILGLYGTSTPSGSGDGGQAIFIAPGFVDWSWGRQGYQIQITYVNGWPHSSLTASVAAGATTINIDDCTGWAPIVTGGFGAAGLIYDGNNQESITCASSSAQSGPGTLTLTAGTTFAHNQGVVVTSLPSSIMWAAVLFACSEALTRGTTATTIQTIAGTGEGTTGAASHYELAYMAQEILMPYRRII